jgi:hypothetical protein
MAESSDRNPLLLLAGLLVPIGAPSPRSSSRWFAVALFPASIGR